MNSGGAAPLLPPLGRESADGRAAPPSAAVAHAQLPDTWLDRLQRWRDRLLADARFQRLATAFPPTRAIARARAHALFDLCAGFVYSQVLFACVQLGLLRRLLDQPQLPSDLAQTLALPLDRLERLLAAASALGLVQRRSAGRIGLGSLGAALLGNPGVEAMICHHALLYADLADPVGLLRARAAPGLSAFWGYATAADPSALSPAAVAPYTRLMAESQQFVADLVLAAYPFARHRRLLDLGGGDGSFALAAARAAPRLEVQSFDLPEVAAQARARFHAAGLGERAQACGGNFFSDPLPRGADLLTLVRVVHDHDDDKVRLLLRAARTVMNRDATLLIAEPIAGTYRAGPMADGYFGFYLMAMGSGRPRRFGELRALLQESGFTAVRLHRTRNPLLASVLTARPQLNKSFVTV